MAVHPYSSTFGYNLTTSAGPFTPLATIKEIQPPAFDTSDVKVTSLTSPARYHQYIPGMGEGGEVRLNTYFIQSDFVTFLTFQFSDPIFFTIVFPLVGTQITPANVVWGGYTNKIDFDNMDVDADQAIMCPITIKVSGIPVFTLGA